MKHRMLSEDDKIFGGSGRLDDDTAAILVFRRLSRQTLVSINPYKDTTLVKQTRVIKARRGVTTVTTLEHCSDVLT